MPLLLYMFKLHICITLGHKISFFTSLVIYLMAEIQNFFADALPSMGE